MFPKSLLCFFSIVLLSVTASAQYTEKINSNRPGTSQGAFAVGNNVLQIEGGLGFGREKHDLLNTKTTLFNIDYAVRYGLLWEQLELRLNGRFRADRVKTTFGGTESSASRSNFEVNTIGAKYLFFDPYKRPKKDSINLNSWKAQHKFKWKSLIPAMSVYVGANFISKDNPFTFPGDASISPRIVFATQNNWHTRLVGNWVLVTNIYIDKISTDDPVIGGLITSTHTLNDNWAVFAELQNQKSDFYSDNIMRLGGAYLWDKNLQLDANLAFNFKDTPSLWVFSFGASYRLDWHRKDEIIEQPGLEGGVKEGEEENENEEIDGINIDEFRGVESDSLKYTKTPLINDFEDDDFRDELERDLDERRTNERLERERIANEKLSKKEEKKRRKEEKRREKQEAKEARAAEKAKVKAEKEKQKMIDEIDAELDQIDQQDGKESDLDALDRELKKLEEEERKLKEAEEEEDNIDDEYERYQKEKEREQKAEEKARKAEEKRRRKEEKKRQKEERKRQKEIEKNNE